MKKAKIMLTAIAVVAVAAGVFAAKAKKSSEAVYLYDGVRSCNVKVTDATTASNQGGTEIDGTFVNTAPAAGTCTLTSVYYTGVSGE